MKHFIISILLIFGAGLAVSETMTQNDSNITAVNQQIVSPIINDGPTITQSDINTLSNTVMSVISANGNNTATVPIVGGVFTLLGIVIRFFEKRRLKRKSKGDFNGTN